MNQPEQQLNVYMVGGAVRDQLMGIDCKDRDWVVVGSSPEQMARLGFRAVGKDFPVFLHPQSNEEYALARTERKTSPGYHGFVFSSNPDVTLQQDLERRDLTMNAIAMDKNGQLIDPFNGQKDIANGVIRHVSSAFKEDPVRILRVAKFAARFQPWNFSVDQTTLDLMIEMVAQWRSRCVGVGTGLAGDVGCITVAGVLSFHRGIANLWSAIGNFTGSGRSFWCPPG